MGLLDQVKFVMVEYLVALSAYITVTDPRNQGLLDM